MKVTETQNILTSLYHVSRDTCTAHGKDIKTRYFGSILILRSKKDQHSIKHDRMQLFFKEHFQPIVFLKVERLKTGERLYERQYLSPRPPPKISLKHDHNWTKGNDQSGSTVQHQPVGKLVQQSLGEALRAGSSKPTQSKPNPIGDRTGKPVETEPVFVETGKTSHSQDIKRLQEELGSSDRTGKPVKCEDNRVMNVHDRTEKPVESSTHTQCKNLILPDIVILHHQTRTSSTVQSARRTLTSTFQDYHIQQWNDQMASTFTT